MIIHAENTTLNRASLYFETLDPRHLHQAPLVGKYFEERFKKQFFQLFSKKDLEKVDDKDKSLLIIYNKGFDLYPVLHQTIALNLDLPSCPKVNARLAKAFKLFNHYFEREFTNIKDLDFIVSQAEYYRRKYRAMSPEDKPTENKSKFSFESVIISVQAVLERSYIDRSLKLIQFVPYFNMAAKISRKQEKKNG